MLPQGMDVWQCLETLLFVTTQNDAIGTLWLETRGVAKFDSAQNTPHNQELSSPKCQQGLGSTHSSPNPRRSQTQIFSDSKHHGNILAAAANFECLKKYTILR